LDFRCFFVPEDAGTVFTRGLFGYSGKNAPDMAFCAEKSYRERLFFFGRFFGYL
jgi:hypothetical protein